MVSFGCRQITSRLAPARSGMEPSAEWHRAEADDDLGDAIGQPLARAQEERHAGPAQVLDLDLERDEGLRGAVRTSGRTPGSVEYAGTCTPWITPAHRDAADIALVDGLERPQHTQLFVAHGVGIHGMRRLHRDDGKQLQ